MVHPLVVAARSSIALVGAMVMAASLTVACGRLDLRSRGEPTPTVTPAESRAQASPTPTPQTTTPADAPAIPGTTIIEGRPYFRDTMKGAALYYEPWIEYQTVGKVKEAFATALKVLAEELNASPPGEVAIFLSGEDQFNRLGSAHGFSEAAHLLGFYAPSPKEVEGAAAGVYLNADGESLFHTLGHELTHAAVPGLPSWFSEGLADYIGTRVEKAMSPRAQLVRMQVFRRLVREAVHHRTLLDQSALEAFDLRADHACLDLDRFYGQAWQLMEFIGRWSGPQALRGLVASYRDNKGGDPFETVLGMPAEILWQRFSADIVENLTGEERVDQSLDDLQRLASRAEAIAHDWDQFLATSSTDQRETFAVVLGGFAERWGFLALEAVRLPAPGPASSIRDLWYLYFQSMALAMQEFAQESDASGNRRVAIANQAHTLAAASLRDAVLKRVWLSCD